jgi:type II secretion system protein N
VKRLLVALIIAAVIVFGVWFIAVPQSMLSGIITSPFQGSPARIEVVGLKKGLFYNVRIDQIVLKKAGAAILALDNISGRLSFSSLLKLSPAIIFHGDIAGGTVRGEVRFSRGGRSLNITLENGHIEEVPFFRQAGLGGSGVISGEYKARNNSGDLKFTIDDAEIRTASFGGIPVPLNMFHTARGAMETNGRTLRIISFAMEGKGIYARLKGDVTGRMLNLTMEIMPDASLERQDPMFSMIRRYEDSPGHYYIPIRSAIPF